MREILSREVEGPALRSLGNQTCSNDRLWCQFRQTRERVLVDENTEAYRASPANISPLEGLFREPDTDGTDCPHDLDRETTIENAGNDQPAQQHTVMKHNVTYRIADLTSLYEFLGDLIVYRNLVPADPRLPGIENLRPALGLKSGVLPRKAEPSYARVLAELLRRARELLSRGQDIDRLVYIGDTRLNDGTAFQNLCAAGGWTGWAFIGSEGMGSPPLTEIEPPFFLANRWSVLAEFLGFLEREGFALNEGTAVVVDVDKTAIGARGRNDKVIDEARVEAVKRTVADLLGPRFDEGAFRSAYEELNQPLYHAFTADNQDYLAYICLILGAGLLQLEELIADVQSGSLDSFQGFIAGVQGRRSELASTGLTSIHDQVWERVRAGDPTPFKAFRYNEYLTTVARFGDLPGASPEKVLAQRIVITEEVRAAGLILKENGCLLFGVSDKPDEASVPSPQQAAQGMKPLHRLETLAVGEV